jgi:hypothetical protein
MAPKDSQRPRQPVIGGDKAHRAGSGAQGGDQPGRRTMPWARGVHGAAIATPLPKGATNLQTDTDASGVPIPDLFDVITYFRARGDSYPIIASIGFWTKENPSKALSARALKRWYETELKRRVSGRSAASKRR